MSQHTHDEKTVTPLSIPSPISRANLIGLRAAHLAERRIEIAASVEAFTSTWSGDAADTFAAQSMNWSRGAARVIEALGTNSTALRHTNEQILAADSPVPRPRTRRS